MTTPQPLMWTTRNGEEIPVVQMSDQHLDNAVHTLKSIENGKLEILIASQSGSPFGDAAAQLFDNSCSLLENELDEIRWWISTLQEERLYRENMFTDVVNAVSRRLNSELPR